MTGVGGFLCAYGGATVQVPLQNDLAKLLDHCSLAFSVAKDSIIAFECEGVTYPASFVGLVNQNLFAGKVLELLVKVQTSPRLERQHQIEDARALQHVDSFDMNANAAANRAPKHVKFSLVGNQTILLTRKDLGGILLCMQVLKQNGVTPRVMAGLFSSNSKDGAIEEEAFETLLHQYFAPSQSLGDKTKQLLTGLYLRAFYSFDRAGTGSINWKDLACAMVLLADGSMDDKHTVILGLFDSKRTDQLLPWRKVERVVNSHLTMALALNTCMSLLPSRYVYSLIEETTEAIVQGLTKSFEKKTQTGGLSVAQYIAWYNNSGKVIMPWVEVIGSQEKAEMLLKWIDAHEYSEDISHLLLDMYENNGVSPRHFDTAFFPEDESTDEEGQLTEEEGGGGEEEEEEEDADQTTDAPLFRFYLSQGKELVLTGIDAELVELVVSTTRLAELEAEDMLSLFLEQLSSEGEGRELSKDIFDKCLRNLIPASSLGKQEQRYLSYTFSTFFYAFDREKSGRVRVDEFLSGFGLLSKGSKSIKLYLAWGLFDVDGDGCLDSISLVRYLRAFLTTLFALRKDASVMNATETYQVIDTTAVEVTREIIEFHQKGENARISFKEFGQWYNEKGKDRASWLELLDLSKWVLSDSLSRHGQVQHQVSLDLDQSAGTQRELVESDEEEEEEEDEEEEEGGEEIGEDEIVFQIPLGTDEEDEVLLFTGKDVSYLEDILLLSDLEQLEPDEVHAALLRDSRGSDITISKMSFVACLKSLLNFEELDPEEWLPLEGVLLDLFNLYDKNNTGRVSTEEIACGMSLLAGGKKSDKLALGFALFDRDRDGKLSKQELARFLYALLLGLFGLTNHVRTLSREQIWDIASHAANKAAELVVKEVQLSSSSPRVVFATSRTVSFDQFADWYVDDGFEVIPWIELYDLQKWPIHSLSFDESDYTDEDNDDELTQPPAPDGAKGQSKVQPASPASPQARTGEAASAGLVAPGSEVVLSFSLSDVQDVKLEISEKDVLCVQEMAIKSGLASQSADEIEERLKKVADKAHLVKVDGFQKFLTTQLDERKDISLSERQRLFTNFFSLFYMYEQMEVGRVAMNKLLCGLLLFGAGKKSEKLSLAFAAFDEDGDGYLTRSQLYNFFMSFLVGLCASHVCSGEQALPTLEEKVRFDAISDCVIGLAANIFTQTPSRTHDGLIDFKSFAKWYTDQGGFVLIPWLELLDLRKWQMALEHQPENSARKKSRDASSGEVQQLGFGSSAARSVLSSATGLKKKSSASSSSSSSSSPTSGGKKPSPTLESDPEQVLFSFQMANDENLQFVRGDLKRLEYLIQLSQFDELSPESIFTSFGETKSRQLVDTGEFVLSKDGFDKVIRRMIDGSKLSNDEKRFLSLMLSSIFSAYDRSNVRQVPLVEFCTGFLVLCRGPKSDKLSVAFDVFDQEEMRSLSFEQMQRYLGSFLTMLCALNERSCNRAAKEVWALVDKTIEMEVKKIFDMLGLREEQDRITFRDFANWYTVEGHGVIPWLELLNLKKFLDVLKHGGQDGTKEEKK